jgi:hypothetical protein
VQYVDARCSPTHDWPDGPCYGCPGCYPGLEKEKILWAPYYDFKGAEWMESKKQEMNLAIQNDTLDEWIKLTSNTESNHNVHNYYFLLGEAPRDGMYFDQALEDGGRDFHNGIILLTITLDKEIYNTGEIIKISGDTGIKNSDSLATITLLKPDETVVTLIQMMPDDEGIVSYHFKAGSGNMDVSGKYAIKIEHYDVTILKQFSFNVIEDTIQMKTIGSDAPFFGIFVYIDNLFSWIMGK